MGQGSILRTNYSFSKSVCGDVEVVRKQHGSAEEKLQKAKDKWNRDRIKQLGFINERLRQKAKAYINNVDEAMVDYC